MKFSCHRFVAVLGTCVAAVPAFAAAGVYIPVPAVPDSTAMTIVGINNSNQIVGSYYKKDNIERGYVGTLDGNYTTIEFGQTFTEPRALNDAGIVIGIADPDGGNYGSFERFASGRIKTIVFDGEPLLLGVAQGINSKDVFVGNGMDSTFVRHAYYGKNAKYKSEFTLSLSSSPNPRGINKAGMVVGNYYTSQDDRIHGFVLDKGNATKVDYPDKTVFYTYLNGINNKGIAVGEWNDKKFRPRPFILNLASGEFTPLHPPGTKYGQAWGVNDAGMVTISSVNGPFIYCPKPKNKCPVNGAPAHVPGPLTSER